jgi:predicted MFS family arabinose efflux permease
LNASAAQPRSSGSIVLALLLLAYIFNFLDRQILGILAVPIKADLNLTDTEFGAIGGLAFALLYSVLGIPLAYLADKTSRSGVIAGALALWSAFTALCGTAQGYWQLFLYRLGVGIGEAGGVAPSYALIADSYPPEQRARALAIFSLGIPLGLALGTLIGAYIAAAIDWRAAFIAMGIAGLVLAPILRFAVRDLPRERAHACEPAPLTSVLAERR